MGELVSSVSRLGGRRLRFLLPLVALLFALTAAISIGAAALHPAQGSADIGDVDNPYSPNDWDVDGLTQAVEGQTAPGSEASGGRRDPTNHYDFFDTPAGDGRDNAITIGDIGGVVAHFGTATGDENYSPAFDRSPPDAADPTYNNAWNVNAPDGGVAIGDIGAVVAQFGHASPSTEWCDPDGDGISNVREEGAEPPVQEETSGEGWDVGDSETNYVMECILKRDAAGLPFDYGFFELETGLELVEVADETDDCKVGDLDDPNCRQAMQAMSEQRQAMFEQIRCTSAEIFNTACLYSAWACPKWYGVRVGTTSRIVAREQCMIVLWWALYGPGTSPTSNGNMRLDWLGFSAIPHLLGAWRPNGGGTNAGEEWIKLRRPVHHVISYNTTNDEHWKNWAGLITIKPNWGWLKISNCNFQCDPTTADMIKTCIHLGMFRRTRRDWQFGEVAEDISGPTEPVPHACNEGAI